MIYTNSWPVSNTTFKLLDENCHIYLASDLIVIFDIHNNKAYSRFIKNKYPFFTKWYCINDKRDIDLIDMLNEVSHNIKMEMIYDLHLIDSNDHSYIKENCIKVL